MKTIPQAGLVPATVNSHRTFAESIRALECAKDNLLELAAAAVAVSALDGTGASIALAEFCLSSAVGLIAAINRLEQGRAAH